MKTIKRSLAIFLTCSAIAAPVLPVDYLIASATADFRAHGSSKSLRFRDVRFGHDTSSDGTKLYMLCGQFTAKQKAGKAEWAAFATIKTSGYEQYLGDQAGSFCGRSSVTWDIQKDLSASLQERFDSGK